MLALQTKRFFGFRKTNAIKALMNMLLIILRIFLYLLALRRLYLFDYLIFNKSQERDTEPRQVLPELLILQSCPLIQQYKRKSIRYSNKYLSPTWVGLISL